ncbi:MAG: fimbrillin family protein [Bacteroidaceae bacterium]|nr:fimbrillin family protein [Bacteroidaceae bacterium]
MKQTALSSICAVLVLLTSCSESDSPGGYTPGEPMAVQFSMTMEPVVGLTRTLITDTTLPITAECGKQIGIYGIRTEAECIDTLEWQTADDGIFQHPLRNCPYNIEAGNALVPDSVEAYYPMGGNPAMAVYAYWPLKRDTLIEGYGAVVPIDLTLQEDILYTGKVSSVCQAGTDNAIINLPFKHALGAFSFKFAADQPIYLENRWLEKVELITTYSLDDAWMRVADGSFVFPFGQTPDTLSIDLQGKAMELSVLQTHLLGSVLLVPGMGLKAIRLFVQYNEEEFVYTIDIAEESLFTIEPGVLQSVTFRLSEAPVSLETRSSCSDLIFTLE